MTQSKKAFTARGPVDLIAAVPYVIGFHPDDSVVLLTFGPGEAFHARVDLPTDEGAQHAVVEMLVDVVTRHGVDRVALLLYTDDPWVAATFHDAAVPGFLRRGVDVIDVVRVGADRFHDADDPDDPGTAYDLTTHAFTAEQVVAGTVVERSREDLAAGLDCVDDEDARAVADAAVRFDQRFEGLPAFVSVDRVWRDVSDEARWVQRTIRRHVRRRTFLPVEDAGRMLVLMAGVPLRDVAWAEMSRADAVHHVDLWRDLVRRCPADLLPGPSCLLAFAAWLSGQGALAWCALDRGVAVDPDYTMAACVAQLLEGAVPPSVWTPIAEEDLPAFWPPPDVEAS
jgi:hypothetical protein